MKSSCTLGLMAALALGIPAAVEARPLTAGPEIFAAPANFQLGGWPARIAAGPDGGFLNSWIDNGALKSRAISPAGVPLGNTRQLSPAFQNPTWAPLAALEPGRFVAVWSARLDAGLPFAPSLVARILDAAGNPLSPSALVLADDGTVMDVAADGAGGFWVAWRSVSSEEVRIRRFDAHGAPAGEEVAIGAARLQGLSVALLPQGGSVLTWFRRGWNTDPPQEIALRIYHPDGTPAIPEILLAQGDNLTLPLVSADAAGRFVAAWADFDSAEFRYRVRARRFAADGRALGTQILAGETAPGLGALPSDVAMRPDGSFLILWGEGTLVTGGPPEPPEENGANVFARAFDAGGYPMEPAFMVHDSEDGEQHEGGAAATDDGWVVSWGRHRDPQAGLYARRFTLSCGTGNTLCLNNGRFRAEVRWQTSPTGPEGEGRPLGLTGDTGAFWFFDPANLELIVKVLDGTGLNDHFWVFYGSLSNVAYELTVTDTVTGRQRTYTNPAGTLASRADTLAFPSGYPQPASPAASLLPTRELAPATDAGCGTGPALCLNDGRFRVEATWRVPATGTSGQGQPVGVTGDTGALWFFDPANLELVVKVLDGRGINGHFWVFYGSLTDVEFDLTVTDTLTGEQQTYHNPAGTMASQADTAAF